VSLEPVSEGGKDILSNLSLSSSGLLSTIEGLGPHVIELSVNCLLEVLLGEYFINRITEFFPANMAPFFGSTEALNNLLKLSA